jgi:hypothetical protein
MAHEFGDYLGLYDEYIGDSTPSMALMGTGAMEKDPQMLPRYYQAIWTS